MVANGSLQNGWFSLGGFEWDIGPRSMRMLNVLVTELNQPILSER